MKKKKTNRYSIPNSVRYQNSMIREYGDRPMNNEEVCETLNRQEMTIDKLNEDAYKNLEQMKRANFEIFRLRKELRELKEAGK